MPTRKGKVRRRVLTWRERRRKQTEQLKCTLTEMGTPKPVIDLVLAVREQLFDAEDAVDRKASVIWMLTDKFRADVQEPLEELELAGDDLRVTFDKFLTEHSTT